MEHNTSRKVLTIEADADQLRQVVLNLVLNACDAAPVGRVSIELARGDERAPQPAGFLGVGRLKKLRERQVAGFPQSVTHRPHQVAGRGWTLARNAAYRQSVVAAGP